MADPGRARRLSGRIKQIVASTMLEMQVKDPRLGMVTITDVRLTGDLHDATLFYTVLGGDEERTASAGGAGVGEGGAAQRGRAADRRAVHADVDVHRSTRCPRTPSTSRNCLPSPPQADAAVEKIRENAMPAGDPNPYREPRDVETNDECAGSAHSTSAPATEDDWQRIWPIWHEVVAAGDTFAYDPDDQLRTRRERMWLAPAPEETWLAADGDERRRHLPSWARITAVPARTSRTRRTWSAQRLAGAASAGCWSSTACAGRARLGYLGIKFNAVAATNVYAIKLYHDLGFTTIGTVPQGFRHPTEGLVDLHMMYRSMRDVGPVRLTAGSTRDCGR